MDANDILSAVAAGIALASSAASVLLARRNRSLKAELLEPETLAAHARVGIAYATQMGGTDRQKSLHAVGASILSDKGKNGRQDWTEAQHRIAIEAELARSKKPA